MTEFTVPIHTCEQIRQSMHAKVGDFCKRGYGICCGACVHQGDCPEVCTDALIWATCTDLITEESTYHIEE